MLPTRIFRLGKVLLARQSQVAHGQDPVAPSALPGIAPLIGKRVELLHVAQFAPGFFQNGAAHAKLKRAVVLFVEGAEGERPRQMRRVHPEEILAQFLDADGEDTRLMDRDAENDRVQSDHQFRLARL